MTQTVRPTNTRLPSAANRRAHPSTKLRRIAHAVRNHPRDSAAQIVVLGRLLSEAKAIAGYGGFRRWFEAIEPSFSLRVAREAMTAARRCGQFDLALHKFSASAVRVLSHKQVARTPELVELLAASVAESPTAFSEARDIVSSRKPRIFYPASRAELAQAREESPGEAIARRLVDLVTDPDVSLIQISSDHDNEVTNGRKASYPAISIQVMGKRRQTIVRQTIAEALESAAGQERLRRCPSPGHTGPNPIGSQSFSRNTHYCKICERRRVKKYPKNRVKKGRKPKANAGAA